MALSKEKVIECFECEKEKEKQWIDPLGKNWHEIFNEVERLINNKKISENDISDKVIEMFWYDNIKFGSVGRPQVIFNSKFKKETLKIITLNMIKRYQDEDKPDEIFKSVYKDVQKEWEKVKTLNEPNKHPFSGVILRAIEILYIPKGEIIAGHLYIREDIKLIWENLFKDNPPDDEKIYLPSTLSKIINEFKSILGDYWDHLELYEKSVLPYLVAKCLKDKNCEDNKNVGKGRTPITLKDFIIPPSYLNNFIISLKTKPFVILAGVSGTGKSKLTRLFAEAVNGTEEDKDGNKKPRNYKLIPVQPDWNDRTGLMGYYNAITGKYETTDFIEFIKKAMDNPNEPYFLCLDEMNLARVEYYFNDFLSKMETMGKKDGEWKSVPIKLKEKEEIYIPGNLFIIGTVNMDETTYQFSPKVLDRANTIEFNIVNVEKYFEMLKNPIKIPVQIGDTALIANIAWSFNEWKGFDIDGCKNKESYTQTYVKQSGIAYEWWNFYDFDKEHFYGYIEPPGKKGLRFTKGIILFISRDIEKNKWYFIGFYGDGEYLQQPSQNFLLRIPLTEDIKKCLDKKKIQSEYKPNIKGSKELSVLFDKEAYVPISTKEDFGWEKMPRNVEYMDCSLKIYKLLVKAQKNHEELIYKITDERRKKKIQEIIKKIDRILDTYFKIPRFLLKRTPIEESAKEKNWDLKIQGDSPLSELTNILKELNNILATRNFHFGYRTMEEITRYVYNACVEFPKTFGVNPFVKCNDTLNFYAALDFQILQKILPKINGDRDRVGNVIDKLLEELIKRSKKTKEGKEFWDKKINIEEDKISSLTPDELSDKIKGVMSRIEAIDFGVKKDNDKSKNEKENSKKEQNQGDEDNKDKQTSSQDSTYIPFIRSIYKLLRMKERLDQFDTTSFYEY